MPPQDDDSTDKYDDAPRPGEKGSTIKIDAPKEGRVLIVGAGIGGLAAAVALRKAGYGVMIFEKAPELKEVGAGLTLQINAMRALRTLNLDDNVATAGTVIRKTAYKTWRGTKLLEIPLDNMARELGSPQVVSLHRAWMQSLLYGGVGRDQLYLGCTVTNYQASEHAVVVNFNHIDPATKAMQSRTVDGKVLIGADGLRSTIRRQLLGESEPRYSGYTTWRGITIPGDFGNPELASESFGPGARFGIAPIGNNCVSWSASANSPPDERDEPGKVRLALIKRFNGWHQPIARLIENTPDQQIVRQDIYDRPPTGKWGEGPISLLGDAAHPMTPDMGQGACQAIEDAVVLADSLSWSRNLNEGLRLYERRRMARAHWFVEESWRLGQEGQLEGAFGRWMRDTSLRFMPGPTLQRLRTAMTFYL